MQFAQIRANGRLGLAVRKDAHTLLGRLEDDMDYPGTLEALIARGPAALVAVGERLAQTGKPFEADAVTWLPPLAAPGKIVCVGLNYADHAVESGFTPPAYPALFARFASTLIGHRAPLIVPRVSTQLDYEGELVAVIGRGGRHIPEARALDHVIGYAIFNDASVRDYQRKTTQWLAGKNFDATGAFGPFFTPSHLLPPGAQGLAIETRLNGQVLQQGSTHQMIFSVAQLVALLSEVMTLAPGDLVVTGTPSGVGFARTPPIFMKPGDVCEVAIEGLGTLANPVRAEEAAPADDAR